MGIVQDGELRVYELEFIDVLILVLLAIVLWRLFKRLLRYLSPPKWKEIPSPPALPIINHYYLILKHYADWHDWLTSIANQYGPAFRLKGLPFGIRVVFLSDPADVEYILKTNFDNFPKPQGYQLRISDLLGNGIFNANGASWKSQRQVASHMFKARIMREDMNEIFRDHALRIARQLETTTESEIDLQETFQRATLDSIGLIAFGVSFNAMSREGSTPVPFCEAFDNYQEYVIDRFRMPVWQLWRYFQLTKAEKGMTKCLDTIDTFVKGVLKERRAEARSTLEKRSDLLSRYMCALDDDGQPYDDTYLRDIIINFVLAGRDTTAQTLTWLFYELSQNPECERRLLRELDEQLGAQVPDYANVKDLAYLNGCINEALRLHPPVPNDPKECLSDCTLPSGGRLYKGEIVTWSAYQMGHREGLWEEPLKFKPERWTDLGDEKVSPFKFSVFQAGPRICLGMNMAYLQARILSATILQHVTLALAPGQKITYRRGLTMPVKGGLMMIPKPRDLSASR